VILHYLNLAKLKLEFLKSDFKLVQKGTYIHRLEFFAPFNFDFFRVQLRFLLNTT